MYVKNMLKSSILSSMDQKVVYFYLRERTLRFISKRGVTVNGVSLTVSETAVNLGHHMSTKDKECTVNAAKNSFWWSFNLFISDYGHIYSFFLKWAF